MFVLVQFTNEAIQYWAFLLGNFFFITETISIVVIDLFRFSISSWFSLSTLYISRNLSTSSRLYILLIVNWCKLFVVVSYDSFYFCDISCNISSLISAFIYLNFLYFLIRLAKSMSTILFMFYNFKYQFLVFFPMIFLFSILCVMP